MNTALKTPLYSSLLTRFGVVEVTQFEESEMPLFTTQISVSYFEILIN